MTIKVAQGNPFTSQFAHLAYGGGIAALVVFFGAQSVQTARADGDGGLASAVMKPVRLAQAGTVTGAGSSTAKDVINDRGFWQGMPKADPVEAPPAANARATSTPASISAAPANAPPRRAAASASAATPGKSTPWPVKDPEPFPNALSYAAQPGPMTTRALQANPSKAHVTAHGDTTVAVKQSDERAVAAAPATLAPAVPPARKPASNSVVRVGDRFNDPWMRALIVTPSAQDYMETTLFGAPDFRNLGPYLEKPATAVSVAFADDPHPGMSTERFAGNPVTFVSTVPFAATRSPTR